MNKQNTNEETAAALRFFGIVTASVSHELNNVNSTIEQIAGLLEDDLTHLADGRQIAPERLQNIHERILRQTRRAAEIIARLNSFAHSADDPWIRFELNLLLDNLVELSTRLAQRHRVKLSFKPASNEVWMTGNPFLLAQVVFGYLQGFWEKAPTGSVIEVVTESADGNGTVRLASPIWTRSEEDANRSETLAFLANRLSASVINKVISDQQITTIAIPLGPG